MAAWQYPKNAREPYWWVRSLDLVEGYKTVIEGAYRSAIDRDPDYLDAHISLGQLLGDLGREDDAMAEFAAALKIDDKSDWAYNAKGWTLHHLKHPDAAIAAFKKAIELNPDEGDNYLGLGAAALQRKDTETALANYKLAVAQGLTTGDAYAALCLLLYRCDQLADG